MKWSPLFVHEWLLNNFRCYSSIGRDSGPQNLVLGSSCYYEGVILHEMNHAVGFFHEQSRYDRDDYIFVNWENVQDGILFQDIAFIRSKQHSPITGWKFNQTIFIDSFLQLQPNAITIFLFLNLPKNLVSADSFVPVWQFLPVVNQDETFVINVRKFWQMSSFFLTV